MSAPHGTNGGYHAHRYRGETPCDLCRVAHADYGRERRKTALTEGTLQHGFAATYDAGCRCDACYDARRVKYFTASNEYKPKTGRRLMQARRYTFGQGDGAA